MRAKSAILFLLLLLVTTAAFSQEITGSITGFVKDPSGAVVPNAMVTVRNLGTGDQRQVTTGAEGEYTVTPLPIGRYEVVVEASGFQKFVAKEVQLSVNDRRRVDANLQVGSTDQTVTVEEAALAVQTEDSTVGNVISGNTVTQMPLNGRNLYQLIALQPGVSAAANIASGRVGVGLDALANVNINGARSSQNNWLLDGADNVDTGSNLAVINYISLDSVAEFKILRSNYTAEFGTRGGGQINAITKSGTNAFHGGAFEFLRNDGMDAVPFFLDLDRNGDGRPDPAYLRYNNFGYNIGGPIVKNNLFFFFNQEWRKVTTVRGGGVHNTRVPTQNERNGIFTTPIIDPQTGTPFANNTIPAGRIDPNATAILSIIPLPNIAPNAAGQNFSSSTASGRDYREELIRIDYHVTDNHRVFGRFINDDIPSTEPFGEVFGSPRAPFGGIVDNETNIEGRNLVGDWNWIVSPTMVNDFSFNYSRGAILSSITGNGLRSVAPNIPELFPDNPAGVLPGITFSGAGGWFSNGTPAAVANGFDFFGPYDNTYGSYRIKDTLSWVRGKHSMKMGYLYSWEWKNENAAAGTNGTFLFPGTSTATFASTGNAFADFLLGRASQYTEADIDFASKLRYQMHEAFFQDDWKMLPNLTLNLGLRWSAILPPYDADDRLTNFLPEAFDPALAYDLNPANGLRVPGTGDPLNGIIVAGQNSPHGRYVTKAHWDTIGPRLGFSWDPFSRGKTVIRGGYGIYFDRTLSGAALQNAFVNPPFVTTAQFTAAGAVVPTLSSPNAGTPRNNETLIPTIISTNGEFKIPTTQQWSFGIQQDLMWNTLLDISYVGNHGTHLLREVRINQTLPGSIGLPNTFFAPFQGYGLIRDRQTTASSRYDSLQVGLTKRMSLGLEFAGAYTWSKVITDSPSDRSDFPQNVRNLAAERGVADFDKTHIFVLSGVYELPFFKQSSGLLYNTLGGWQLGGISRIESGRALTILQSGNSANSFFGGSIRPNLVGDPQGPEDRLVWFNTTAFAAPAPNTFGNAGRGIVRGPGIILTDLAIYKNFRVTERIRMQFRTELFNAFNHTNWNTVGTTATFNAAGVQTNADFGRVLTALEPRQIQLGLKLNF